MSAFGQAWSQLSDRHQAMVMAYLKHNCNASKAYQEVWPDHSYEVARVEASRIINRPDVKAALEELRVGTLGSPLESLARMQFWARCSIADVTDEDGNLDLNKARETGAIHAIKSITYKSYWDKGKNCEVTEKKVELHDAKDAEKLMMKYHGLLVDVIKVQDLPTNPDDIATMLAREIERATGRKLIPKKSESAH